MSLSGMQVIRRKIQEERPIGAVGVAAAVLTERYICAAAHQRLDGRELRSVHRLLPEQLVDGPGGCSRQKRSLRIHPTVAARFRIVAALSRADENRAGRTHRN